MKKIKSKKRNRGSGNTNTTPRSLQTSLSPIQMYALSCARIKPTIASAKALSQAAYRCANASSKIGLLQNMKVDTVNILKAEGYKFPPLKESDAMFSADTAPEWADGEVCHRCRTAFTLMVRRHHCRACGQVFCQQCSSKTSTLPKFGIEKEVRVCDACFDKVSRPPSSTAKLEIIDTASDYGPAPAQFTLETLAKPYEIDQSNVLQYCTS